MQDEIRTRDLHDELKRTKGSTEKQPEMVVNEHALTVVRVNREDAREVTFLPESSDPYYQSKRTTSGQRSSSKYAQGSGVGRKPQGTKHHSQDQLGAYPDSLPFINKLRHEAFQEEFDEHNKKWDDKYRSEVPVKGQDSSSGKGGTNRVIIENLYPNHQVLEVKNNVFVVAKKEKEANLNFLEADLRASHANRPGPEILAIEDGQFDDLDGP